MKLLGYGYELAECDRIRELLAAHGIPTYVGSRLRNRNTSPLFICINQQYEDAVALMKDEKHVVSQPIDVARFDRAARSAGLNEILKDGLVVLGVLLLVAGMLIALRWATAEG